MSTASDPLRVQIVTAVGVQQGGAENALLQLLEHRQDLKIDWRITFLEDGPLREVVERLGISTRVVEVGRVRQPWRGIGGIRRLAAQLRTDEIDVVLSWMTKAHLYAGTAAALTRTPALWFQHGLPGSGSIDRLARGIPSRGVFVPSRLVGKAQKEATPNQRTWLAYPGVSGDIPEPLTDPVTLRRQNGIPVDAPLVVMVARLQRWKGVHVLVQALPAVLAATPDVHIVIVGAEHPLEPGYREEVENNARALNVDKHVHFVGHHPQPQDWMAIADVVVHASSNEPFGIVVLEAMAVGRPVVAGANGGPTEIITDGVDGLLSPFGDVAALAARVTRLLEDRGLARSLAQAGQKRAAEFTPQRFAERVAEAVHQVAASSA